ncbi:hypothetical protein O9H85_07025 [Paenibacillus filicis]|uniref:Phosphatase n=1 Tax=Paenibacillus gyeongsangnamensis TaxID=3388067 RepID=A0ABT4Q5V7_9BACL|nr:hypothetical protein [Paenibacillus filicis]MCZ8512181.1 hypothetical protein [Paenibacillus filicis]
MKKLVKGKKKLIAGVVLSALLLGSGSIFAASSLVVGAKGDGTGVNPHG